MCVNPIMGNAVECPNLDKEEGSGVVTTTQVVRNDVVEVDLEGKRGLGRERREAPNPVAKPFESSLQCLLHSTSNAIRLMAREPLAIVRR
jgi:hypothetical protein